MDEFNVFKKGSGVIVGVVDGNGIVVAESVMGFGLLVDQIRRGLASEENLLVVKREVLGSGALRNHRSLGTTLAALFKQREPGLVSGRVYRPIRVYHKVGEDAAPQDQGLPGRGLLTAADRRALQDRQGQRPAGTRRRGRFDPWGGVLNQ